MTERFRTLLNAHIHAQLFQTAEGFLGVGGRAVDSFRLVGADGHGYAGHLRDELLDEALAVLIGADEVPEGLSAVDEDAGPVEVALRFLR